MNNFILINKNKGETSFDVIRALKKKFGHKKFGHTGTLDPMATGLLVIANGKEALKAIQFSNAEDKEYIATLQLGFKTNTGDITGEILNKQDVDLNFDLNNILNSFIGKQKQTPPQYSSKKINGKKAYEYARQGNFVELKSVEINIKELELISHKENKIIFRALVSKGTYIRTLCEDIASKLGNLGTMATLHRTKVGELSVQQASPVDDISNKSFVNILDVIRLPQIEITKEQANKIKLGQRFYINNIGTFALVYNNKVLSIVKLDGNMKILRNFNENY